MNEIKKAVLELNMIAAEKRNHEFEAASAAAARKVGVLSITDPDDRLKVLVALMRLLFSKKDFERSAAVFADAWLKHDPDLEVFAVYYGRHKTKRGSRRLKAFGELLLVRRGGKKGSWNTA